MEFFRKKKRIIRQWQKHRRGAAGGDGKTP